jgi:hypothetical protein
MSKIDLGSYQLPVEALVQTFAIMGIRGSGKSTTARVLAEELYAAGLPWIAVDPGEVWWGVRAGRDGSASGGLPVVVFGGKHGDLPIGENDGERIAEALVESNICAVIDLSGLSKKAWRKFVTAFFLKLLSLSPKTPRMVFLEEAAEFVPQRTKVAVTAQCKEAVERFVRLGRNSGYGLTLINQRPATVDKDVLSQCENLIMMRITQKHDRKACEEWLEPKFYNENPDASEKEIREKVRRLVASCVSFPSGTGYFWSPSWLGAFEQIKVRDQRTFHPGETRKVGVAIKSATLVDVQTFVEKVKSKLSKTIVDFTGPRVLKAKMDDIPAPPNPRAGEVEVTKDWLDQRVAILGDEVAKKGELASRLQMKLNDERFRRLRAEGRLNAVREIMALQYKALQKLFGELGEAEKGAPTDRSIFEPWLAKAGRAGCKRLLEVMIDKRRLQKTQLATLAGIAMNSTFRSYMAWLKRNGLVSVDGDTVSLAEVPA